MYSGCSRSGMTARACLASPQVMLVEAQHVLQVLQTASADVNGVLSSLSAMRGHPEHVSKVSSSEPRPPLSSPGHGPGPGPCVHRRPLLRHESRALPKASTLGRDVSSLACCQHGSNPAVGHLQVLRLLSSGLVPQTWVPDGMAGQNSGILQAGEAPTLLAWRTTIQVCALHDYGPAPLT